MNLRKKFRLGVAAKLALCVVASTAAFFSLFGFLNLRMERGYSRRWVEQSAERVSDLIRGSARFAMLRDDREALYQIVRQLGSEQGIQRIRIFNKDGRITLSSQPGEVGRIVDKGAEGCVQCHSSSTPLVNLGRQRRGREFWDDKGTHMLGVMQAVYNSPDCSSAECHFHSAGQRVLGVIDAHLSLAAVDEQIGEQQRSLTWFLVGAILLVVPEFQLCRRYA